ncbi:ATP-binding protein [Candidatus Saccharibacteria bacterium]|nr:ATP-binding protein [Candidatus Saccharibacteria bacterium]
MKANNSYLPRLIDEEIREKLSFFGAVSIDGCKWCGKSTTAEQFAKSTIKLQDPANASMIEAAKSQPDIVLNGDKPRLIDEWQDFPEIWDAIRTDIDDKKLSGQYLLTGSSTPRKATPKHSGAGRIATVKMRPMSLYESGDSSGEVSLKTLFETPKTIRGSASLRLENLAYLCARGGWPESVIKKPKNPTKIAREYLEAITEREGSFKELDYYSPGRMRALLRSLARGVSEPARLSTVTKDIAENTGAILSDATVSNYVSILEKIHIIDDIEAWSPLLRSKTEIRTGKKRNLVDPSLAVAALYASENDLTKDFNSFGLIFESLAMRDLKIYSESLEGNLFYYRDKNGLECDAIVHLIDGSWGAFEVKLGDDIDTLNEASKTLLKLESLINSNKMPRPSFLAILSGSAKYAYRRKDGVYIVPIGCLKP